MEEKPPNKDKDTMEKKSGATAKVTSKDELLHMVCLSGICIGGMMEEPPQKDQDDVEPLLATSHHPSNDEEIANADVGVPPPPAPPPCTFHPNDCFLVVPVIALVLFVLWGPIGLAPFWSDPCQYRGSGNIVHVPVDIAALDPSYSQKDFYSGVSVQTGLSAELSLPGEQDDKEFAVVLQVDDNLVDRLTVERLGTNQDSLVATLKSGTYCDATFRVLFRLPHVSSMEVRQGSELKVSSQVALARTVYVQVQEGSQLVMTSPTATDTSSLTTTTTTSPALVQEEEEDDSFMDELNILVSDRSHADIELGESIKRIEHTSVTVRGGSQVTLKPTSVAGNVATTSAMMATMVSEASQLQAQEFQSHEGDFVVNTASDAEIHIDTHGTGTVRTASHVTVYGGGAISAQVDATSSLDRKEG